MTKHHTICREWMDEDRPHPPERRLCAAVMLQAIEDVTGRSCYYEWRSAREEQEQAFWWLFVAQEHHARLSAQFCAHVIEYELNRIRTWLWEHHHTGITMLHTRYVKNFGPYGTA